MITCHVSRDDSGAATRMRGRLARGLEQELPATQPTLSVPQVLQSMKSRSRARGVDRRWTTPPLQWQSIDALHLDAGTSTLVDLPGDRRGPAGPTPCTSVPPPPMFGPSPVGRLGHLEGKLLGLDGHVQLEPAALRALPAHRGAECGH